MNNNGVIYYKLEERYDGDVTKYCGLTGGEVDSNMFFLRGNDIDSVKWDNESETLIFTRVNGETINITGINNPVTADKTYYDSETGILYLTINGTTYSIEGFYVREELTGMTYSSSTLKGRGTIDSPISVSDTLRTGFFAPVERFIDLTVEGNSLPTDPLHGSRFLTKESVNDYGLLYNFEGVKRIQEILKDESSMWRVPTFEEWSEMFNAIEHEDIYRNHLEYKSNKYNGLKAGAILKKGKYVWTLAKVESESQEKYGSIVPKNNTLPSPSHVEFIDTLKDNVFYEIRKESDGKIVYEQYSCVDIWEKSKYATPSQNIKEEYNFSVIPVGVADGISHNYKEYFGKKTGFWSSTQDDSDDVWSKYFYFDKDEIKSQLDGTENYLSVRLVRDYLDNFSEVEMINGMPYNTVLMPSVVVDENGKILRKSHKVWTLENISFNELLSETKNKKPLSINVKDESGIIKEHFIYFINYWNGKSWDKRTFNHNEMVIIGTGPDGSKDEEWQLINTELVKRSQEIVDSINLHTSELVNNLLNEHKSDISNLLEKHNTDIRKVSDKIDNEIAARESIVSAETTARTEAVNAEATARQSADEALSARIDAEIAARESAVSAEATARQTADEALGARIDAEIATCESVVSAEATARQSADEALGTRIEAEIAARESAVSAEATARQTADEALGARIDAEIAARESAVSAETTARTEAVSAEATARQSADEALGARIDAEIAAREESDKIINASIKKNNLISIINTDNSISPSFSQEDEGTTIVLNTKLDTSCEFLSHDDGGLTDKGIKKHVSDEIKKASDSILEIVTANKQDKDSEKEMLLTRIGEVASKSASDIASVKEECSENNAIVLQAISQAKEDLTSSIHNEETSRIGADNVLDLKIAELSSKVDANNVSQETNLTSAIKGVNDDISTESQRAKSAESGIMAVIGEGYNGETITNKINTIITNNASDITEINSKISENESAITSIGEKLTAFLSDADMGSQAIDTLKEIQEYINGDGNAATTVIANIEKAQDTANKAQSEVDALEIVVETNKTAIENVLNNKSSELSNRISAVEGDYLKQADKDSLLNEIEKEALKRAEGDAALTAQIKSSSDILDLKITNLDNLSTANFGKIDDSLSQIKDDITESKTKDVEHSNSIKELDDKLRTLESSISVAENEISTEASARQTADEALGARIDAEIAARESAVSAEATARTEAVNAEATARQTADEALGARIDNLEIGIPSLDGYATEGWVKEQKYITLDDIPEMDTKLTNNITILGGPLANNIDEDKDEWPEDWRDESNNKIIPKGKTLEEILTALFFKIVNGAAKWGEVSWSVGLNKPSFVLTDLSTNKEVASTVEAGTNIKITSVTKGSVNGTKKRSCTCETTEGYFNSLDGTWNKGNKTIEENKTQINGTASLACTWRGTSVAVGTTLVVNDNQNTFIVSQSGETATSEKLEGYVYPSTNMRTVIDNKIELVDNVAVTKNLASSNSKDITGVRYMFWGSKPGYGETITSDIIRNIANGGKQAVGAVSGKTITMGSDVNGVNQFIVAIPQSSGYKLTSAKNATFSNDETVTSFVKSTVNVEGANGYTSVPYDVYLLDQKVAWTGNASSNKAFEITISK